MCRGETCMYRETAHEHGSLHLYTQIECCPWGEWHCLAVHACTISAPLCLLEATHAVPQTSAHH